MSATACYIAIEAEAPDWTPVSQLLFLVDMFDSTRMPIGPERQLSTSLCNRCFTLGKTYSHSNRMLCWKCISKAEAMRRTK